MIPLEVHDEPLVATSKEFSGSELVHLSGLADPLPDTGSEPPVVTLRTDPSACGVVLEVGVGVGRS